MSRKIRGRTTRYLALQPLLPKRAPDQIPGEVPDVELQLVETIYQDPKQAARRADYWSNVGRPGRQRPRGLVVIVDLERLEPLGLPNLELAAFCENQMEYWGRRMQEALASDAAGESHLPPPRFERRKPRKRTKRRAAAPPYAPDGTLSKLATQAIAMAGAVVIGNMISKALTEESPSSTVKPGGGGTGSILGLLGPDWTPPKDNSK